MCDTSLVKPRERAGSNPERHTLTIALSFIFIAIVLKFSYSLREYIVDPGKVQTDPVGENRKVVHVLPTLHYLSK